MSRSNFSGKASVLRLYLLTITIMAVFLCAGSALALPTVDGVFNLTEWDGYYTSDDGVGSHGYVEPGWGGQAFDVEYQGLYFNNSTVAIGLQTGFNLKDGNAQYNFGPGDFGLNIDGDDFYEYAIDFDITNAGDITFYLVDMSNSAASWDSTKYFSSANPFEAQYTADAIAATFGGAFSEGVFGNNSDGGTSYVLEAIFDLSLLSGYSFGDDIGLHWTMECGNDVLNTNTAPAPAPEPATMLMLGMGLMGLGAFGRKKFDKR